MRLGVMGGTFDPVHHGHLVAASEVQSLFSLDEVAFVPSGQPWQKAGKLVSPAEHRYLMTVIATASNPHFWVSRVDIDRPGPTYTIDTLRDLSAQHPDAELFFITGADALEQILSCKDADELFGLAHFVGVTRPGYVLSDDHLPRDALELDGPDHRVQEAGRRAADQAHRDDHPERHGPLAARPAEVGGEGHRDHSHRLLRVVPTVAVGHPGGGDDLQAPEDVGHLLRVDFVKRPD